MSTLADIFASVRLALDDKGFQVEAAAAGGKAGDTAGDAMSEHIKSKLRKGAGSFATGIIQGMGQQAFRGIEDVVGRVVTALPDLIAKGQAYAETVDDIADRSGATAEASSKLAAAMTILGVPTQNLGMALKTISTQAVTAEDEFVKLGIATRDANGVALDAVAILDNVRRYMAANVDGTDKLAAATKLLGKSGGDWIDLLNMTDAQYARVTASAQAYGLILDEKVRAEGEKAAREQNALNAALTGLGVTLFAEVSPMIRAAVGSFTQFIADHMEDIKNTVANVVNFIAGAFAGLFGGDFTGLDLLSDDLANLGGAPATEVDKVRGRLEELNAERKTLVDGAPKVVAGSNAETAALERQTKAIDRQIAALDREDAASEKLFQRQLAGLAAVYQAQLDALDLADRQRAAAQETADAATELAAAQEALFQAQHPKEGEYDPAAEMAARQRLTAAQAAQAEVARRQAEDAQRTRLEATKSYVESVAQLEANAENRKALATTLSRREAALKGQLAKAQATGDQTEIANVTARLEAVQTAETRNNAALRTGARRTELQTAKDELAALKTSIKDSIGGGSSEAQKDFEKHLGEVDAKIEATTALLNSMSGDMGGQKAAARGKAQGRAPLGSDGSISKGLAQTAADAVKFGEDVKTAIQGIPETLTAIGGGLETVVGWLNTDVKEGSIGALLGIGAVQKLLGVATVPGLIATMPLTLKGDTPLQPGAGQADIDWMRKQNPDKLYDVGRFGTYGGILTPGMNYAAAIAALIAAGYGRARGGPIPAGTSAITGDAGVPEIATALPGGGAFITPLSRAIGSFTPAPLSVALPGTGAAGGLMSSPGGVPPHSHPIYIGRRQVAEAVSEEISLWPRR